MKDALQYLLARCTPYAEVPNPHDLDLVAVPDGAQIQSLEKFKPAPDRIRAHPELTSSASFCDYINRFKGENSTVYIDVENGRFQAVLDHHGENSPTWREHTASFAPKKSREWLAWTAVHEQWLGQLMFALLVERMLDTIFEPEPSVVLKAALDFQANEKLVFGSAQGLDDGTVRFNFQKDNATKSVTFPHRIKLYLPVHENESTTIYEARIRYRVTNDADLNFQFSFVQDPQKVERDALLRLAEKIKAATEGLAHYEGRLGQRA